MYKIYDYYVPSRKYELIVYLGERYPQDIAKFKRLKTRILKAIYHNLRNRKNELRLKKTNRRKELSEV